MSEPVSAVPVIVVGEGSSRGPDRLAIAIVVALIVAFWGHVARFGFVYDDQWTIITNPIVDRLDNLVHLLSPEYAQQGVPDAARPVMLASVMIDRALWGSNPFGFHLQNLIWHSVVCILLLLGLRHITQSLPMALFATAMFGVHPLVSEPVTVVNYREDMLAAAFILLGLFAIAASRRATAAWPSRVRRGTAFLCFFLAAGAKESAYVAPLLVLLLDHFVPRALQADPPTRGLPPPGRGKSPYWYDAGLATAAVALMFGWRAWAMGHAAAVLNSAETASVPFFFRLIEGGFGFMAGVFHVIWPLGLSPAYDPVAIDGLGLSLGVFSLLLLAGYVVGVVWLRCRLTGAAMGLAWALLAYLPTLGLVPITSHRADRYLYLPLIGLVFAVVVAAARLSVWLSGKLRKPPRLEPVTVLGMPLAWLLAAVAVVTLGLGARKQSLRWADEENLWLTAVTKAPDSPRAWAGWASILLQKRQPLEAQMAADTALARFNGDPRFLEILGLSYLSQGSIESACQVLRRAGDEGSPYDRAQRASNLGYCLMRIGRYAEALKHFEHSRKIAPWLEKGWTNAAETLRRMGRAEEAEALQRAFEERR